MERENAIKDQSKEEADKIEQKKIDDAMAWAAEEEAKDRERDQEKHNDAQDQKQDKKWTPSEEDRQWMEDQMAHAKAIYGEDFGEDINEVF